MKTKHVSRRFRCFAWANEAVSALEYAMLTGVIAVGIATALVAFEDQIDNVFENMGGSIEAMDAPGTPDLTLQD